MKYFLNLILSLCLTFFLMSCSNKFKYKNTYTEIYFENNEANNYKYSKLENYVKQLVKSKRLNYENEVVNNALDILDTKEKAAAFAKQIAIFQFPKYEESIKKYECKIVEDKTTKMWLVEVKLSEMGFDNVLKLLV